MSAKGKENAGPVTSTPLKNAETIKRIKEQPVLVAAVSELMKGFRPERFHRHNCHRFTIQPHFEDQLKRIIPKQEDYDDLNSIDFVLMASCFFSSADLRELTTLVQMSCWLFILAGQLKSGNPQQTDYFNLKSVQEEASGWVAGKKMDPKKVLAHVKQILEVHGSNSNPTSIKAHTHNAITEMFEDKLSGELKEGMYGAQLDLFLEQLEYFMEQAQKEKEMITRSDIPTMDEYRAVRKGVAPGIHGIGVLLSLVLYAARLRTDRKITDVPLVKQLWDETTWIVTLTNDMQLFPQKLADELSMNIITIYTKETGVSVQTAADEVFGLLRESISSFEQFGVQLLTQRELNKYSVSKDEATVIVDGFRKVLVGNYRWMRYLMNPDPSKDPDAGSDSDSDPDFPIVQGLGVIQSD